MTTYISFKKLLPREWPEYCQGHVFRSSGLEVLRKKAVLRNFAKFTGKNLRAGVFLWILRNF